MDWRVFVFSASVCVVSTLLFGLVPRCKRAKADLSGALKAESTTALGGRGKSRVRSGLVLAQVSLSFILVVGAVCCCKAYSAFARLIPGFSADNVLASGVNLVSAATILSAPRRFRML